MTYGECQRWNILNDWLLLNRISVSLWFWLFRPRHFNRINELEQLLNALIYNHKKPCFVVVIWHCLCSAMVRTLCLCNCISLTISTAQIPAQSGASAICHRMSRGAKAQVHAATKTHPSDSYCGMILVCSMQLERALHSDRDLLRWIFGFCGFISQFMMASESIQKDKKSKYKR